MKSPCFVNTYYFDLNSTLRYGISCQWLSFLSYFFIHSFIHSCSFVKPSPSKYCYYFPNHRHKDEPHSVMTSLLKACIMMNVVNIELPIQTCALFHFPNSAVQCRIGGTPYCHQYLKVCPIGLIFWKTSNTVIEVRHYRQLKMKVISDPSTED